MKKTIEIIILLLMTSCSDSPKESYEGYVYENNIPLSNVLIIEDGVNQNNKTVSNNKGYFKLKRSSENFIRDLIFVKDKYKTDTVKLVRGRNSPPIYFLFLRNEKDTIYLKKIE